jgi:hypothetical protein
MGVMKRIKGKLTKAKKFGGVQADDANVSISTRRLALGDVTNDAGRKKNGDDFSTNTVKTPGKKKTATKTFRTADVFTKKEKKKREEDRARETTTTTTTAATVLKAVEIFEDDDQFEKRVETAEDSSPGKLKAPPPSLEASSASPSSSSSSSSSKSALEAWADALVGLDKEEGKQPETPTKVDEEKAVVFSSNASAAEDSLLPASPIVVSYELSESECGSPMCGGVEERVLENIDVEEEEEQHVDTLESYLFTPPPVMSKESAKEDAVEEEEEEIDEEKRNTQSARLSLSMWDVNSTSKMINVSFLKNVSAMDVAMGAGVAAVVFNFFMPSFLKASF